MKMQSHLKYLRVILLTTSMILSISGQSVEKCEINSGNCIHGQCINGVCVCETCWTGENCGDKLSRKPTFVERQFTFEKKLSDIIDGGVIGRLPLSDENSSIATCGNVHFEIVSNASQLPIYIDSKSGVLYSDNLFEKTEIYRTVEFNVTIREDNNHLGVLDQAVVRISVYNSHSDEDVERRVSRVKRAIITPPTVGSIKFYRSNTLKDSNYCLYDTWFVDLDITLPPGNHTPIINVYGPAISGSYRGYIEYLFSNFSGVNVVNNSTVQFSNLTYIGGRSSPSRFTMLLGRTRILSSPATSLSWGEDWALSSSSTVQRILPIFVTNNCPSPLNITYIVTVGSTKFSGYFTFYTDAPELSTSNLSIQYSPTLTNPNGFYGHMCSGTTFALSACHVLPGSRCAFFTTWINRISPGVGSMNVSQISNPASQSSVHRPASFSIKLTYLDDVIRADYGPICVTDEVDTTVCFPWTVRLMSDCNQTTTYNFVFPVQVQINGRPENISAGDIKFSFTPVFTAFSQMIIELTPPNMNLQPGQIGNFTIIYTIPLNTNYTKFTVSINCTANTSNVDAILTVKGFQIALGSNLASATSAYSFNYLSSYKTGQLDQLTVYFDRVINSATALGPLVRNTLSITVKIQLSDSQRAEIGTTWPVQFTSTFTSTSTITRYNTSFVTCTRTGLEKPIIQFALSQLSVNTLQDCVDRYLVYIQTLVQMNNETGLECETQSIFFYFGSPVESINVFNQTGNNSEILTTIPLDPATRSVKFSVGPLYFGQRYSIVFQVKYPESLRPPVVKLPVLVEVVCKPYERSIALTNKCRKSKFFRFMSPIRVEVDTYPCDLPHYVAMKNPKVPLLGTRLTTFLNVGDRLFYCGRVLNWKLSFEEQRRCFMISPLPQRIWSGALLGLGANGGGALKSLNFGLKWIAVNSFEYQRTVNASTQIITASVTPWISLTGSYDSSVIESSCRLSVLGQWKVCIDGIYANQLLTANWNATCPKIQLFKRENN
uniref:EGF-like domain-containing protein n=1 Tax=Trichobilharzia regenti TaxID=157069 RepID=A0AA85KHQ4_TRIRE|nr:unnamed protein product [Trichobilharzia regenti]